MAALPLIVFDVNETLLDLGTMEPTFERIFGDKSAMRLWFVNLILYSVALTVADSYVPFTDIGSAVMKMLADTRGIKIRDEDKRELRDKFSRCPRIRMCGSHYPNCTLRAFGCSLLRTTLLRYKRVKWNMPVSNIFLNGSSAWTP